MFALGQPDVEITKLDDGKELAFTAEVDVRPKFDLPDLNGMPVTVDNAEVDPDEVEEYIGALRERFASLKAADRPVRAGRLRLDRPVRLGGRRSRSRTPGQRRVLRGRQRAMLDGLDDALAGMSAGESKTFSTELAGGEHGGVQADVTVKVHSVKVKELPELDDEFAQSASDSTRWASCAPGPGPSWRRSAGQQAGQARDRALDAVLAKVDIPLPEQQDQPNQ